MPQPTLTTPRLVLRPFVPGDAPEVARLAGEREIAANTLTIPHPYPEAQAHVWIASHEPAFERGTHATFAMASPTDGLVGAIGVQIQGEHRRAELGYWVGKSFWGMGYCTEAGGALLAYGFQELGLERIYAHHFTRNPASGRVLQKLGMRHEGSLRRHIRKWEVQEDLELYGILREEFGREL